MTTNCDCDYWHSKHRWHCATNYTTTPDSAPREVGRARREGDPRG